MSIKQKVQSILFETSSDVINNLFHSEISEEINKWSDDDEIEFFNKLEENKIKITRIDNYGGEGMGEEYWSVYKFDSNETHDFAYVKFDGWYQSYHGSEFTEWYFVEPKEVIKTKYIKV